ncbi:MAG: hypothetical protein R3B09_19995 [Nannocystaceae bacterium]
MTHARNHSSRSFFTRALLVVGLFVGGSLGMACNDEDDGDDDPTPVNVRVACGNYCDQRAECNDEFDVDDCETRCKDAMRDCQADEQDQAVEDLNGCAQESCDDVVTCAIGAGSQCFFGI